MAVSRDVSVDAGAAASILSEVAGRQFRLAKRLSGGETGAHLFIGPDDERVVVKWGTGREGRALRGEAVAFSERLRCEAGWPVPSESTIDGEEIRFVIQEFMAGTPPSTLDHRLVDQLLELHSRRLGLAKPHDPVRWPTNLITTIAVGGNGYCLHEPLLRYDHRTRSLIGRIEAFGCTLDADDFVGQDIVHWDFHSGNLLVEAGGLSAVVDTDFAMVGDAGFDLVMLALTSEALECETGVRSRLFAAAFDDLDEFKAQAYLAHLFVRLIDWPIRRGSPAEVDLWLARADELLTI
jgi:hypothetical protein